MVAVSSVRRRRLIVRSVAAAALFLSALAINSALDANTGGETGNAPPRITTSAQMTQLAQQTAGQIVAEEANGVSLLSGQPLETLLDSEADYAQGAEPQLEFSQSPDEAPVGHPLQTALKRERGEVRPGDSFSGLMERLNAPYLTAIEISRASKPVYDIATRLRPGKPLEAHYSADGQLQAFFYAVTDDKTLAVRRNDDGRFTARMMRLTLEAAANGPAQTVTADAGTARSAPDPLIRPIPAATPSPRKARMLAARMNDPKRRAASALTPPPADHAVARLVEETVRNGDHLAAVLARADVTAPTALSVAESARSVYDLARKLKPGKTLQLAFDKQGQLVELSYPVSKISSLVLSRVDGDGFRAVLDKPELDMRMRSVSGTVNGSLFIAARRAGLSQPLAVKLAGLFEWDVDFARDIRAGDRFTVIYEEYRHDGKKVRDGDIVAARFVNQGNVFEAFRFTDGNGDTGYYDSKGNNVQKMFIRAPVDYTRISSRFSKARKHPILGFTRAHKGVDYAAPTGTPIRAAGNGRVIYRAYKGGFGNLVLIRHNSTYTTAYAHMSRYARNLKPGSRVRQGQVIGYVGATGKATGPHLHYEVRVRGVQVNPLSVKLPSARSLPRSLMPKFRQQRLALVARLNNASPTVLAALKKEG
ncbi:putative M23 peptidase domain-containing protein [Magnetofaba australis IT-1]|uniref:Putative M23 peptidase domain-containing protein n=1 Tax=Magnetofaba australis IT-1 TaxID=1434232 RepID=A0A1Y2JZY6_9PROT|nr:putative M23 peptidase domain-containing protein [Magnetofaba australis IT-1]